MFIVIKGEILCYNAHYLFFSKGDKIGFLNGTKTFFDLWKMITSDRGLFVFQGTLPPPYSSKVPSEANGSLSSPVSTMTSQSSASSHAKHRQSWLDLVSQTALPTGETAVVCSAQVHTHQPPQEETEEEEEEEEEEDSQVLESSDPQNSSETRSNEENPAAGEGAQRNALGAQGEGETLF